MKSFDIDSRINLQKVHNTTKKEVIWALRENNLGIDMQFTNYLLN